MTGRWKSTYSVSVLLGLVLLLYPSDALANSVEPPPLAVVVSLRAAGLMIGDPEGDLRWDDFVTRAEAAKILILGMGLGRDEGTTRAGSSFRDVSPNHWASGYLSVAAERGLLKGYPDGTCRPDAPVSKRELGVMLARVWLALGGVHADSPPGQVLSSDWASQEVSRAPGVSDLLAPVVSSPEGTAADRSETAEMVFSVLNRLGGIFHMRGIALRGEGESIVLRLGSGDRAIQVEGVIIYGDRDIPASQIPEGRAVSVILDSAGRCAVALVE